MEMNSSNDKGSNRASRRGPSPSSTFPAKLLLILSNPEVSHIITWMPHGRSWRVIESKLFAEKVMPRYFAHQSKYSSFTRQVNGWRFKRITHGPDRNSYYHNYFLRDFPQTARRMTRRSSADARKLNKKAPSSAAEETEPNFYEMSGIPYPTAITNTANTLPISASYNVPIPPGVYQGYHHPLPHHSIGGQPHYPYQPHNHYSYQEQGYAALPSVPNYYAPPHSQLPPQVSNTVGDDDDKHSSSKHYHQNSSTYYRNHQDLQGKSSLTDNLLNHSSSRIDHEPLVSSPYYQYHQHQPSSHSGNYASIEAQGTMSQPHQSIQDTWSTHRHGEHSHQSNQNQGEDFEESCGYDFRIKPEPLSCDSEHLEHPKAKQFRSNENTKTQSTSQSLSAPESCYERDGNYDFLT